MGKKADRKAAKRAARAQPATALIAAPAARTTVKFALDSMMASNLDPRTTITPFNVAKPAPGVMPEGIASMAMDAALQDLYAYAQNNSYGEGLYWPGYPYLAELAQRPEYRRISETIAREMTRRWIKLTAAGDEDKTKEIIILEAAMKKYHVQDVFRRVTELDGFFGRAQIYIDTGSTDDSDELKTPLLRDKSKIPRKGLKGLRVIEPMWSYPTNYNSTDPLRPDFYKPRTWYVRGREIHASRLLTIVSREVPDMLKPAYAFGGLSMSQMARPYVENWLRTRQSVSDLLHSFSVSVLSTDMVAMQSSVGGDSNLVNRAIGFNLMRDNRGVMMINKETEEFSNVSAPLGTLDHLQAQSQEQMASVSGIPLVVLLGITPSGLNASSDGEIRTFYMGMTSSQEQIYTSPLDVILDIIQLSELGEIDPAIRYQYLPLWQLDDEKAAAVRKQDADTSVEYINAGVLSPLEERTRLAAAEDSLYPSLDVEDLPEPPGGSMEDGMGAPEGDAGGDPPGRQPPPGRTPPGRPEPPGRTAPGRDAPGRPEPPGRRVVGRGNVVPFRGAAQAADADPGYQNWWDATSPGSPIEITVRLMPPPAMQPSGETIFAEPEDPDPDAGASLVEDREFSEADHPRGQPDNAGQFGPGGAGRSAKPAGKAARAAPGASSMAETKTVGGKRVQANGRPLPPHIAKLAIPPAWANVRYDPDPKASLLVVGKDSKGRRVSLKSKEYSEGQSAEKYVRISALAKIMPQVISGNAAAQKKPATHDIADCLDLIIKMGIRPGSERDTGAEKQAYGATTLEGRHVVQNAQGTFLRFVGKEGIDLNLPVEDKALAHNLAQRAKQAGAKGKLFGESVGPNRLRAHFRSLAGSDFTTKDLRTNLGTQTAMRLTEKMAAPTTEKERKAAMLAVAKQVSAKLGNTPVMAMQSYIAPEVWDGWKIAA